MTGQANSVHYAEGTFDGDATNSATFFIGFEPDVIIVTVQNHDVAVEGWTGPYCITIIKNAYSCEFRHNSNTTIVANGSLNPDFGEFPYGYILGTYNTYGQYANGYFTVAYSGNNSITRFQSGQSYKWQAYKG